MRPTLCSLLALTTLLAAGAVYAQTDDPGAPPDALGQSTGAGAQGKEKEKLLRLLDHTQSLARWMPNGPSVLSVLARVQEQLAGTDASELAPLREFEPHLSHLEATLSRMQARMSPLQAAVEICDPARRDELFLLFLDTLDADGQREVHARICGRIASAGEKNDNLAQVCIATNLAFLAAKSMRELVVGCDPSLEHASADGTAERFDHIEQSVQVAKRDLTQVMTAVADHVAEVSSANTNYLQETLQEDRDHARRLEIEKALQQRQPYGAFYLPEAHGGQLETVRTIVSETIQNILASGETANGANAKLVAGDDEYKRGHFKKAFRLYSEAYVAAVGIASAKP